MNNRNHKKQVRSVIFHAVFLTLSVSVFVFVFWELRSLILPIIIGALLAYIFRPLKNLLNIPWVSENVKTLVIFAFLIIAITMATTKIKNSLPNKKEQKELQVRIKYKFNEKYRSFMGIAKDGDKGNFLHKMLYDDLKPIINTLNNVLALTREQARDFELAYKDNHSLNDLEKKYYTYFVFNEAQLSKEQKNPIEKVLLKSEEKKKASNKKLSAISSFLDILATWLLMPFVFIFLMFDKGEIFSFFVRLIPNRYFEPSLKIFHKVDKAIGNYLRGTLLECSLVGMTFIIGLFLIGIKLNIAIAIGVAAGLTNAIPFLGPAIGMAVGLAYALIAEDISPVLPFLNGDNLFVGVLIVVGIAQLLDNILYQPVVLGSAVNLHPLVVIIGVMGGSIIFGFAGMLLAIPTIVVFKEVFSTLIKEFKDYGII